MLVVLYLLPSSSGIVWLSVKMLVGIAIYAVLAWVLNVAGSRRFLKV
jgi:hypothetical protein